jgi:hypothetical protein
MPHAREQIRDAAVTALTGLTTTGTRVYRSRIYPLAQAKLPGLAIYTKSESTDYATQARPRTLIRTLSVAVEAYVSANTDFDETIDDIASEVEAAMYTNLTLGGLAKDSKISGIEIDFSGDGENPVAVATLTIDITYVTTEGSPNTAV